MLGEHLDAVHQVADAADVGKRHDPDDHDPARQEDALERVDVRNGAQPARRHVDQHHQRQQPHPDLDVEQAVGQNVEEET